jgi:TPR repeat protein
VQCDNEAASWFQKAADKGNALAQMKLATLLREGRGVSRNDVAAARWYKKAAHQGVAEAQYHIGEMSANGCGVKKSYPEAAQWFKRAAEQGHVDAQVQLGLLFDEGRGGTKSAVKAAQRYYLAAEQGDSEARCHLDRTLRGANLRLFQEHLPSKTLTHRRVGLHQKSGWGETYKEESNDSASDSFYVFFSHRPLLAMAVGLLFLYILFF